MSTIPLATHCTCEAPAVRPCATQMGLFDGADADSGGSMKLTLFSMAVLAAACSSSVATGPVATAPEGGGAAADGAASSCTAAIAQTLMPIDKVALGIVTVVPSEAGAARDVFVQAASGGLGGAARSPYIYVNLDAAMRVNVTDVAARTSMDWDLAFKRYVIFTNGGDGGVGQGAATHVTTPFESVTAADATGMATESFFDANCNGKTDLLGGLVTTFSDWYSYDQATNRLAPQSLTYIVRGGTGKLYKVAIETYYASLGGGPGVGGNYVIRVAAL